MLRILGILALLSPLAVRATDAAAITRQGNGKGAAPCMACHGVDGGGMAVNGYPRLAGLDAAYLRQQLDDFASGARANPVMQPNASALSGDERAALAKYYSALPLPARPAAPPAASVSAKVPSLSRPCRQTARTGSGRESLRSASRSLRIAAAMASGMVMPAIVSAQVSV